MPHRAAGDFPAASFPAANSSAASRFSVAHCFPAAKWLALSALALVVGCGGEERVADGQHYPDVDVIDNMEDGTQYILSDDGRVGLWYTYNDASATGTQGSSRKS